MDMRKSVRTSPAKLFVHLILPAFFAALAIGVSLLETHDFVPNAGDYGIFTNLLWNFAHGNGWLMTLYTGEAREFFLADHLVLLTPLFSLAFMLAPSPYTLSVLHGLAFATIFFLVPVYVREVFKHQHLEEYLVPTIFLLFALWLFPGFSGAWRFQSHMTTLSMPFALLALIFLHRKQTVAVVICCILLALAQERSAVAVFSVGMYAFLILQRYKLGFCLCLFATCYFFVAVKFIIPWCAGGEYMYMSKIQPFYDLAGKLAFLGKCCLTWFFLVLFGKRAILASACAMPLLMIGLVSSRTGMYSFSYQYQDLPSVFLFAGATYGVASFSVLIQKNKKLLLVGGLVVLCSIISMEKYFFQKNPLYRLLTRTEIAAIPVVNKSLEKYTEIPEEIRVFSSGGIEPRLATRKYCQHITLDNSARAFQSAMVFVAPTLNMYPYTPEETAQILTNLRDNPSLVPIMQNEHLHVYASKDINWP